MRMNNYSNKVLVNIIKNQDKNIIVNKLEKKIFQNKPPLICCGNGCINCVLLEDIEKLCKNINSRC
jgi:hypothetical protein